MNASLTQRGMLATRMQRRVRVNANRVLRSSAVCKKVCFSFTGCKDYVRMS
jgi:hypothetical protein